LISVLPSGMVLLGRTEQRAQRIKKISWQIMGVRRSSSLTNILRIGDHDVLLVVDLQNDFCPGGSLAVPRGHEIVPLINMLAGNFAHVVLTQDWHPHGHLSFASSHQGKKGRSYGQSTAYRAPPVPRFATTLTFHMPSWFYARVIIARSIPIRRFTKMIAKRRLA
jgi:hypothetical protein